MIDTHVHLDLMTQPTNDVLADCVANGVQHVVQVAVDPSTSEQNVRDYAPHPMCSVSVGVHPLYVAECPPVAESMARIQPLLPQAVAVGETGLDYHYGTDTDALQHEFFYAQCQLAHDHGLPLIIHMRKSEAATLAVLNQFPSVPKVIHCYSTGIDFYHRLLGSPLVSFTGLITYSSKGKIIRALKEIPLDRIMIETDSPYLMPKIDASSNHHESQAHPSPPTPTENSPALVPHIAKRIADIKGMPLQTVIDVTTETAIHFFKLPQTNEMKF